MGLGLSALSTSQVVAAALSMGLFLLLWMLDTVAELLPAPLDNILLNLSLLAHLTPFATGSLYLSNVGFFISLTLLSLFLTVRALARA